MLARPIILVQGRVIHMSAFLRLLVALSKCSQISPDTFSALKRISAISYIMLLFLPSFNVCAHTESSTSAYPIYQLMIPKNATLSESDPEGAIEVHDQEFLAFMQAREEEQNIFYLSISLPWSLTHEDDLSLMTIEQMEVNENGESWTVELPTGNASYFLGPVSAFRGEYRRTLTDRFEERNIYMGFFQVFKETCWGGGHCFYTIQLVPPSPERAAETYKIIRRSAGK